MNFFQRLPLSPMGWAALGVLVLTIAGAVFALRERAPYACALDEALALPSGRAAELCEVISEEQPFSGAVWLVLRVVVPDLARPVDIAEHSDHDWVCSTQGLPRAWDSAPAPQRVVVQFMGAPFPRGEAAPEIRQSIEAYSIIDGSCMWELF